MNFVFLMDPLETVNIKTDTSYIFMAGAVDRGHKVFFMPSGGMAFKNSQIEFNCIRVTPNNNASFPFDRHEQLTLSENEVDAVFVRTDPPFDSEYLMNTWLLDRAAEKVKIINSPSGIRTVNEKVWGMQFSEFIPDTVISRRMADFKDFLEKHKNIIIKPTDGFGGSGVFKISKDDPNKNVSFEVLSNKGSKEIIMQQYIPEASIGDKRILLLNGEPLGAVLRVHGKDDHRNNFYAGGKPEACEITARDTEVINALKPHLVELGLYFVGIDMLGDYLIEVNVTSPTCLQEMNRIYNKKLHHKVIEFTENLVKGKV